MPDLRSKIIRLAHAQPELRRHLLPLLKTAGDVLPFRGAPRNPNTVTIAGDKYVLSTEWPAMAHDPDAPDAGGAKVVFVEPADPWKYLWAYDTDKQVLAMWRVSDGNEKQYGPARSESMLIVKLAKKNQLNRVTTDVFRVIERYMARRADDSTAALEAWVEELKNDSQRRVDTLTQDFFDAQVRPAMDKAVHDVGSGVIPLGFKATQGGMPLERQMKSYVTGRLHDMLFTPEKVETFLRTQGVDLDAIDPQAVQWAQQDVWLNYVKSVLR